MATEAQKLMDSPSKELKQSLADAAKMSKASDSLFQQNFRHEDGSLVVVTSFRGDDPKVQAFDSTDDVPTNVGLEDVDAEPVDPASDLSEDEDVNGD